MLLLINISHVWIHITCLSEAYLSMCMSMSVSNMYWSVISLDKLKDDHLNGPGHYYHHHHHHHHHHQNQHQHHNRYIPCISVFKLNFTPIRFQISVDVLHPTPAMLLLPSQKFLQEKDGLALYLRKILNSEDIAKFGICDSTFL